MSIIDKLIDDKRSTMPATAGTPTIAAARASVPPDFDETHAPTPQALSEAAVKVRNLPYDPPTFEPPTKETRPFILADHGGFLTKEENRAWLMGIEQMAKSVDPYPPGTPGRLVRVPQHVSGPVISTPCPRSKHSSMFCRKPRAPWTMGI